MRDRDSLIARLRGDEGEFTEEDRARRGHQARQILESDVFRDAYFDAELTLMQEWKDNDSESPVGRERCHAAVKALDVIWLSLSRIEADGVVAEEHIRAAEEKLSGAQ